MNKNTGLKKGVFSMITGKDGDTDMISKFINEKSKNNDPRLVKLLTDYEKKVNKISKTVDELSDSEEIILQLRALDNITDIKLVLVRNTYIYARANFYRHNNKQKDIRVIVDKVSNLKVPFENLTSNKKFMTLAKNKLREAMSNEIDKTLTKKV